MDPGSMPLGNTTPMNMSEIIAWLNLVVTIGLTLFIFVSRRYQATRDQITKLDNTTRDQIKALDNEIRQQIVGIERAMSDELRDVHRRVSSETRKMDNRITSLEEWRKTVPGTVDVQKLYTELATVKGDVKEINTGLKAISESVGGVKRSVSLINDHLLQQDKQLSRTTKRSGS